MVDRAPCTPKGRERLIKLITNGFSFFALVVLVTETILAITAINVQGSNQTFLIISAVLLLIFLTTIVALLLYFRPWVLTGDPPPPIIINQLTPPPLSYPTVPIQYFLKGVRETYVHVLADMEKEPPVNIRINIMLVLPGNKNFEEKTLRIIHVDYDGLFAPDELLEEYPMGAANCGEAWKVGRLRAWASDMPDVKRIQMNGIASSTAKSRNSVLSSPIFCAGDCIGVLNLDSSHDSRVTNVQLGVIQSLFAEAAREIVPLLFPATRTTTTV